jgi:hypothetical protein
MRSLRIEPDVLDQIHIARGSQLPRLHRGEIHGPIPGIHETAADCLEISSPEQQTRY